MKIENLSISYGDNVVFENFNLDILDGKITCILGRSGVGKTTLLRTIGGLLPNNSIRESVSYVFQDASLIEHLTIEENLGLLGYSKSEIISGLQKVGLLEKINEYPNRLSGGEKQRVNIIRAFLKKRQVMLLDEPFSQLDLPLKIELIKVLVELQKESQNTVIFVTHDIEVAIMLANNIVVLKHNKVAYSSEIGGNLPREYGSETQLRKQLAKIISE